MVKNTKGGGKQKKQASKHCGGGGGRGAPTRFSQHPDEIYACCTKLLGNATCYVLCQDGVERICIIRKKFKGRGKRDNVVTPGVWVLVGKRSFELVVAGKKQKTDLLEVYSSSDQKTLTQSVSNIKWAIFNGIGTTTIGESSHDFEFGDENGMVYETLMEEDEIEDDECVVTAVNLTGKDCDKVDVDDI
jgi:translation initiation factor IF-1